MQGMPQGVLGDRRIPNHMSYSCPVCKYRGLEYPPANHNICPCCGTEFGYDDNRKSHAELRRQWIMGGAHWFDGVPPVNWDPNMQLYRAGKGFEYASVPTPRFQVVRIFSTPLEFSNLDCEDQEQFAEAI